MAHQITSTNLHLRPDTISLAEEKLQKIEKLLKDVGEELKDIRLVIDKGPRFGFITKVEVFIPSTSFIGKEGAFSLEGSIDEAVDEVIRQFSKHKGKVYGKNRELLRKLKRRIFLD